MVIGRVGCGQDFSHIQKKNRREGKEYRREERKKIREGEFLKYLQNFILNMKIFIQIFPTFNAGFLSK